MICGCSNLPTVQAHNALVELEIHTLQRPSSDQVQKVATNGNSERCQEINHIINLSSIVKPALYSCRVRQV
eukprot:300232-Chlamydomonas_euryale.AAC.1